MQSPYKKVLVYDLETGGFDEKVNSITEIAIVVVDLETLEIEEEFSVMFKPRIDLGAREIESIKEAKRIWKLLAEKDQETKIKTMKYKGKELTLAESGEMISDIELLYDWIEVNDEVLELEDIEKLLQHEDLKEIVEVYYKVCYHPQALAVTSITREMLIENGVGYEEGFTQVLEVFESYKIGNSKPILSGHNIKKFDNPFVYKMFEENGQSLDKHISGTQMIDTLEWSRLKWFTMPNFSLGTVANEVGVTLKNAHRALDDTKANAEFLIKMLENLRGVGLQEKEYTRRKFKFNI